VCPDPPPTPRLPNCLTVPQFQSFSGVFLASRLDLSVRAAPFARSRVAQRHRGHVLLERSHWPLARRGSHLLFGKQQYRPQELPRIVEGTSASASALSLGPPGTQHFEQSTCDQGRRLRARGTRSREPQLALPVARAEIVSPGGPAQMSLQESGGVPELWPQVSRQHTFREALAALVTNDLSIGYFKNARPDAGFRAHSERCLEITLLRHRHTRSATVLESPQDGPQDVLAGKMLSILNGDWSHHTLQHLCFLDPCPCGGTLAKCIQTTTALLEAVLLDRIAEKVPAASRWHTVAPTMEAQGLGLLCHNVLGRLSQLAANNPNALAARPPAAADQDEDAIAAFRAYNAKKDAKCRDFLSGLDAAVTVASACCLTEPVDHLMARLQRLDDCGHGNALNQPSISADGQ
jgi:hypothetical protein